MKCNNCGYTNAPNRLACEHCNAPLKGSVIASASDRKSKGDGLKCTNCGTLNGPGSLKCGQCNAPLKGSMLAESGVKTVAKPVGSPAAPKLEGMKDCPNCGYPNLKTAPNCIRCAALLVSVSSTPQALREEETPKVRKLGPLPSGTINPWSAATAPVEKFSLQPMPRKGEKAPAKLDFEGEKTELTRENLESSNRTITSKVQAAVEYKDGAWHLTDQSAQKSTFIMVRGTVKLQKGDILLMGDRMFEFDC